MEAPLAAEVATAAHPVAAAEEDTDPCPAACPGVVT